jgi:hypothetical protein
MLRLSNPRIDTDLSMVEFGQLDIHFIGIILDHSICNERNRDWGK